MEIRLKVRRQDAAQSEYSSYSEYTVDLPEGTTMLDALLHVRDHDDGSLALRYSCRSSICGSCAMRVNGRARLACKTKASDMANGDEPIVVEPMGNMPVIKDLVTDMEVHWDKVRQITPWLQNSGPEPEREYLVSHDDMLDVSNALSCIQCGACVSDCPVLKVDTNFIGPAALAKAYRFVGDPRDDQHNERLQELSAAVGGIWDCTRCNMCVEVCPKDIRPMDRIMQLREQAVAVGVKTTIGVRHGNAFAGSVRRLGRLDEFRLLPESVGLFNLPRMIAEMSGALWMFRVGKLPWQSAVPFMAEAPIPGIKHVRRMFDRVRKEKKEQSK